MFIDTKELVSKIESLLAENEPEIRKEAVQKLIELSHADEKAKVVEFANKLAADQDILIRKEIALHIPDLHDPSLISLTEKLCIDKSPLVRQAVAYSLSNFGMLVDKKKIISLALQLCNDLDNSVRRGIAYSLPLIGGSEAFELLERLSKDEHTPIRQAVAYSLVGFIGSKEHSKAIELANKLSTDSDLYVCQTAKDSLKILQKKR